MNEPEYTFDRAGLGYRMELPDIATTIEIDRIKRSASELHGDLIVRTRWPGARAYGGSRNIPGVLIAGRFNLSAIRTRKEVANVLKDRAPAAPNETSLDWYGYLEIFCQQVLVMEREGAPFVQVGNLPPRITPRPTVDPLLPRGKPTILFGDGGVGKGFISVAMGVSLKTGLEVVPGFVPFAQGEVVYLDWESDEEDMDGRIKQVAAGIGTETVTFHYRFCSRPLADMVEEVARIVRETAAQLLIVDSVGAAMGGQGEHSDPADGAIRFFAALRIINTTALCVDHVSKIAIGMPGGSIKPYGSTYKANLARCTWEMRQGGSSHDGWGNVTHIALFNRKSNIGPLHKAIGLAVHFGDGTVFWENEEISDPDLSGLLPLADRIVMVLAERGELEVAAIVEATGSTRGAVSSALHRHSDRFRPSDRGKWRLEMAEG